MSVSFATSNEEEAREFAKRVVWLAYQAAIPMGMGRLHYREGLTEDQVWQRCSISREWDGLAINVNIDYLVGRMMKLYFKFNSTGVVSDKDVPSPEYQSWCTTYKTYEELFSAAEQSLAAQNEIIDDMILEARDENFDPYYP